VDRDNIDQAMGAIAPRLERLLTGPDGTPISLAFGRLSDLHPDQLLQELPLFQQLRELRRAIERRETFSAAAAALQSWTADAASGPSTPAAGPHDAEAIGTCPGSEDAASPLDAALEATLDDSAARTGDQMLAWKRLVRDIAQPFAQPNIQMEQQRCLTVVDEAIAVGMRAILHHRAFRQLESAWRALQFLVTRTDTSKQLKIFLLNVSREELAADVLGPDLSQSRLRRVLVDDAAGTAGGVPWSLLVGDFHVGPDEQDARLVQRLGELARQADAPWILGARDELLGWTGSRPPGTAVPLPLDAPRTELWQQLRQTREAPYVGLVWPRLLLRLPYGRATSKVKMFPFEEILDTPRCTDYLWGNGAFLAGLLIAQSFARSGSSGQPGDVTTVDRLPLHIVEREEESWVQPCGEVWVHEDMIRRLIDLGIMPLVSVRDQDVAGIARFTSIAHNATPLAGRWR
jgi:type VI secretion system protein ImpC